MPEPHAPRQTGAAVRPRRAPAVRPELLAFAALLIAGAALLVHETRGVFFWLDDWEWVLHRRGWDAASFLRPHNEHLSIVPIAIYKLLFVTAGITHALPYRLVIVAGDLVLVALVFAYARRRVGDGLALVPAALLMFCGAGWQVVLWPFEIGWIASTAAGVGALLALDRDDRRGDVGACALLAVALASSGVGIAVAAGLVVELAWHRRRWACAWIAAIPIALYLVWWLAYHPGNFALHRIVLTPRFVAEAFGGSLAALTGLRLDSDTGASESLSWGRPLALVGAVWLGWSLTRMRPIPPRLLTVLAIPVAFWVLTGLGRAGFSPADASRYAYVGAVYLLLVGAELFRGARLPRAGLPWLAAALLVVTVVNVGNLRAGARFLRSQYGLARADLGALDVARGVLPAGYVATAFPGYPFAHVHAADWFAAERDLGSPALTPAQLASAPPDQQQTADTELQRAHRAAFAPGAAAPAGARPAVDAATGGTAAPRGSACVRFTPAAAAAPDAQTTLDLTLPPGVGLALTAGPGQATVSLRRYSAAFTAPALGTVAPSASAVLRIAPDRDPRPWHVRVSSPAAVTACGLGGP